ncbi:C-X-C motif chemokine 16 isoform X2 [Psammomys obesus]|uniref:C-X-C motif chemokine 16 isoform X2 n=1 Tax=Psammomys obesus TaxID=48139 RepID=UPI002453424B|nr:C-X-C motif chemokine 16 isoform X2 [Psammomys obesus]XP_055450043.1 C-X-C motif chemokine 16 isoform X2 [Psammomys obesus]XP_055450044.1 C-X-C motif chemokine 16 isoform X2 [Psammomys obesus]
MRRGAGPRPRLLLLLLLAQQALPGDGNRGSVAGSCLCDVTFPSGRQMRPAALAQIRRKLESLTRCPFFIRFQLQSGTRVCGGSRDPWVRDLVSCLERHECGNGGGKSSHHREHSPHASTRIPEATEGLSPDTSTPAQTQQAPLPSGAPSLNSSSTTHHPETTTVTSAYGLEAASEAKAKEKQQDKQQEKPRSVTGTATLVPVLSLLAIVFLLTAALLYVLCKRRVTRQRPADGQLHYEPVNQAPRA